MALSDERMQWEMRDQIAHMDRINIGQGGSTEGDHSSQDMMTAVGTPTFNGVLLQAHTSTSHMVGTKRCSSL
jgi:hypothetical protein